MITANTMRDQVEVLPDLDEFSGMSIVDIAQNIIHWPEGSEEQFRAIAAIKARAPGIGDNRPPLADRLSIDLEGLTGEADALVDMAGTARIIDEESAGKVNDLVRKISDKEAEIEAARKLRNKPYADAVALVNSTYNAIKERLNITRIGADEKGGLRNMLTVWDNKKRADAEAARRQAQEEQAQREREAEEARQAAEQARQAGDQRTALSADLNAAALADKAERAEVRAATIRPEPTRSHLGTTSRPRRIVVTITDEAKAITWALKQQGLRENVVDDFKNRVVAYLRSSAIGVKAVERGVNIPGVTATTELGQVTSRR